MSSTRLKKKNELNCDTEFTDANHYDYDYDIDSVRPNETGYTVDVDTPISISNGEKAKEFWVKKMQQALDANPETKGVRMKDNPGMHSHNVWVTFWFTVPGPTSGRDAVAEKASATIANVIKEASSGRQPTTFDKKNYASWKEALRAADGDVNSARKEYELNSSLGGGDDRQDATSQVTVPKSFPDDKVHDLYRWVESELWNEGIDVDVYGVGRPSAGVISFDYEVVGKTPAEVDAIIEDRVQDFIQNGYQGLLYPEGDPRHGLNSEKHEKSLNCKVENARVEPTEQGTWVVKADTDRFGKDSILYEHYSEEGANKYLDRLKAGGL